MSRTHFPLAVSTWSRLIVIPCHYWLLQTTPRLSSDVFKATSRLFEFYNMLVWLQRFLRTHARIEFGLRETRLHYHCRRCMRRLCQAQWLWDQARWCYYSMIRFWEEWDWLVELILLIHESYTVRIQRVLSLVNADNPPVPTWELCDMSTSPKHDREEPPKKYSMVRYQCRWRLKIQLTNPTLTILQRRTTVPKGLIGHI